MAQKDPGDGPSLELPSLGFGRKRTRAGRAAEPAPALAPPPGAPPEPPRAAAPAAPVTPADADPEPRRRPSVRQLGGMAASVVTGLVAGLLLVGLIWLSTQTCDLVRGTSSCGRPGFPLLLAVLVVVVVAGRVLLGWFGVPDPGSTSFLALGLVAVAALLFLSNVLVAGWVAPIVVALSVAAFALSHWVTTAFVEPSGPELRR